jgi:hypothetical protein
MFSFSYLHDDLTFTKCHAPFYDVLRENDVLPVRGRVALRCAKKPEPRASRSRFRLRGSHLANWAIGGSDSFD